MGALHDGTGPRAPSSVATYVHNNIIIVENEYKKNNKNTGAALRHRRYLRRQLSDNNKNQVWPRTDDAEDDKNTSHTAGTLTANIARATSGTLPSLSGRASPYARRLLLFRR